MQVLLILIAFLLGFTRGRVNSSHAIGADRIPKGFSFLFSYSKTELIVMQCASLLQIHRLKRLKPVVKTTLLDRWLLLYLARIASNWKFYIRFVAPSTFLKWIKVSQNRFWFWKAVCGIFKAKILRFLGKAKMRGRKPTAKEIVAIIRRILTENPQFGAGEIRKELLKNDLDLSRSTVNRYLRNHFPHYHRRKQITIDWKTLACGLTRGVWSMDFFTVFDAFCRQLFCFFIIDHGSRKVLHFNATYHPNQFWVMQQIKQTLAHHPAPEHWISDNDPVFVNAVSRLLKKENINHIRTAYRSPWQNPVAERVIGTIRRDIFDRTLVFGSQDAINLMNGYLKYYNHLRCHTTLDNDSPEGRAFVQKPSNDARLVSFPVCDGLVHHYAWQTLKSA